MPKYEGIWKNPHKYQQLTKRLVDSLLIVAVIREAFPCQDMFIECLWFSRLGVGVMYLTL